MSSNQIKYQIVSSNPKKGQGNIDDIKNTILNRAFSLYSCADQYFDIDLRLESPSIITSIDVSLINAYKYTLKLLSNKNNVVEQFRQPPVNSKKQKITINPTIKTQPIRYVHLHIQNNPYDRKKLGIRYVILNGINDYTKDKKQSKNQPNSKENKKYNKDNHQLFQTQKNSIRKVPKHIESLDIFNNRSKQKSSAQKIAKLIDFTDFDNQMNRHKNQQTQQNKIKKKVKYNQDNNFVELTRKSYLRQKKLKQQTDLAIALSKSQQQNYQENYQKMEIENEYQNIGREKSLPAAFQDYIDQNFQVLPQRTYQTVQFNQQYISSFSDLSPAWLKAQRLAQEMYCVRQDEKLSKKIRLKYLYDSQIYIDGFEDWKMDQFKHLARDLGCTIINQLKNHCIAIVSKVLCQKLRKKHKQWKQIKYLTANYLQDCIKYQQKLNPKDYYIRI